MSTLYRDYRPQNFSEVLGQNHVKITLQNEIAADRPASAYLFCGPRAVGKTTLARVLAKTVNCENRKKGESEPCNKCAACKSITAGNNLDIIEIDAASNTGVDNVRENIISFSRLTPSQINYKVFIIDEVHMLSTSAFNALLKIIEEPPSYVIFILCTTEIQKVPATIISRCERFDFKRISVAEIVKKLSFIAKHEKVEVEADVLEAVARQSGGHLRDAESLLGQIFSLSDNKVTREQAELVIPHYNSQEALNLVDYLSHKDAARAVAQINSLVDSGINIKNFTLEIVSLLRKIMINKLSPELSSNLGLDLGESVEKRLIEVTGNLSWEQIFSFTRAFLSASTDNRSPLIPQLPLEIAVTELCFGQSPVKAPLATAGKSTPLPTKPKNNAEPIKGITQPIKKNEAVQAQATVKPSGKILNIAIEEIKAKWPEFLVKIKKQNHSLSFVIQNCEPREVKDGKLSLIFKYKFHQDRVNDPNIRIIVENVLEEVYGSGLSFQTSIEENLEIKPEEKPVEASPSSQPATETPPASGLMADLLKTFGGEIVN